MYEKYNGAKRLIRALYNISDDSSALFYIASATNYHKPQLKEDIQALYDYMREAEQLRKSSSN